MNYAQIRAFHLTVQEGGVGRAAAALNLSQPTISQHIKDLEARSNVKLFHRLGKRLALTDAGRDLLSVTTQLMTASEDVDRMLDRQKFPSTGKLTIATDSARLGAQIVKRMLKHQPDLNVTLRLTTMGEIIKGVEEGDFDAGISVDPPLGGASLFILPIRSDHLQAAVSARNPLAAKDSITLQELSEETLIYRDSRSRTRVLTERAMSFENLEPKRVLDFGSREVIREAVAHDIGVALFSTLDCQPDSRIRFRPVSCARMSMSFVENAIVRRDKKSLPEIASFLESAKALSAPAPASFP